MIEQTMEYRLCSHHGSTDPGTEDEIFKIGQEVKQDKPDMWVWVEKRKVISGKPRAWVRYSD